MCSQEKQKDSSQLIMRNVAQLLAAKLHSCGVFRQVYGQTGKPFEDPTSLFRFHSDEDEGDVLNCRHLWLQVKAQHSRGMLHTPCLLRKSWACTTRMIREQWFGPRGRLLMIPSRHAGLAGAPEGRV